MRNAPALSALLLSSAAAAQTADPDGRADRVVAAMQPEEWASRFAEKKWTDSKPAR